MGAAMLDLAWAALGLLIATLLFLGFTAWVHDGYAMLGTWIAGNKH